VALIGAAFIGAALISAAFIMWPFFCDPNGMEPKQSNDKVLIYKKRVITVIQYFEFINGWSFQ
jgi:hypothetical protein